MPASTASESTGGSTGSGDRGGVGETLAGRDRLASIGAERSELLARRMAWADLLKWVFEVDALCCPGCGGRMRLLAAITDLSVAQRILECLALSSRAPPLAPANEIDLGPDLGDRAFEQTHVETRSDPGFDFDQSGSEVQVTNEDS